MKEITPKDIKTKFMVLVEDYNVPLSPWYILNTESFREGLKQLGVKNICINSMFYFEKDFVLWGPNEELFTKAADIFKEGMEKDNTAIKKSIKGHYVSLNKIEKIAKEILEADLNKKTNKQLYSIYGKAYKEYAICFNWALPLQFLDMGKETYSQEVKNEILEKLKKIGNPEIVFSKLITPVKDTKLGNENIAILQLIKKIQSNKDSLNLVKKNNTIEDLPKNIQKDFIKIAGEYGFMQYYYAGPAAEPQYYFDTVKKRMRKDAAKEIKKINKEKSALIKYQQEKEKYFNKQENYKIQILREFTFLKEIRKEIQIYYLNFAMHKWYKEVGKRFGWSPLQTRYIVKNEFEDLLINNKQKITTDTLNARYNTCTHILYNNKTYFIFGEKVKGFRELYEKQTGINKNTKEIKGNTAYPGKIKGKVKIVNSVNDLDKFNEGDVLVSFSTNPSLVPAMNKAKAIITNTGGVTCHAAIVSRELKIPCVIGTKIATKVLQDGDMVEVDASKGVIKKLK